MFSEKQKELKEINARVTLLNLKRKEIVYELQKHLISGTKVIYKEQEAIVSFTAFDRVAIVFKGIQLLVDIEEIMEVLK